MIAIIPFLFICFRWAYFSDRAASGDLPGATAKDYADMRGASKKAFFIMLAFTICSFIPYTISSLRDTAWIYGIILGLLGLIGAAIYDLKAANILKRLRGPIPNVGRIRWYHIIVALFVPYIALPWASVNIIRNRTASGIAMLIISVGLLTLILFSMLGSKQSRQSRVQELIHTPSAVNQK